MKISISRGVNKNGLLKVLKAFYRPQVHTTALHETTYTVIDFPRQGVITERLARKALSQLGTDTNRLLITAYSLTRQAAILFQDREAIILTQSSLGYRDEAGYKAHQPRNTYGGKIPGFPAKEKLKEDLLADSDE